MASDRHMTTARKIARSYFRAEPSRRELLERDIKRELAKAEREGMRRAAEIVREQEAAFLTPEYTADQPLGSISERVACRVCADLILSQAGEDAD